MRTDFVIFYRSVDSSSGFRNWIRYRIKLYLSGICSEMKLASISLSKVEELPHNLSRFNSLRFYTYSGLSLYHNAFWTLSFRVLVTGRSYNWYIFSHFFTFFACSVWNLSYQYSWQHFHWLVESFSISYRCSLTLFNNWQRDPFIDFVTTQRKPTFSFLQWANFSVL